MTTVAAIQRAVCERYGVTLAELKGPLRSRHLALPRHVAMYLGRKLTRRSLPQIGVLFGSRDHSTVTHAVKRVEELLAVADFIRETMAAPPAVDKFQWISEDESYADSDIESIN